LFASFFHFTGLQIKWWVKKEHVISQSESVALNEDNFTRSPPSGIGDDFGYPVFRDFQSSVKKY
jgi:hypothetical protein